MSFIFYSVRSTSVSTQEKQKGDIFPMPWGCKYQNKCVNLLPLIVFPFVNQNTKIKISKYIFH